MKGKRHKPATHKPSWPMLLIEKLNRLSFPSLTQGPDKLTEAKHLAGQLSILQHHNPECLKSPIVPEKFKDGKVRAYRLAGKQCPCIMAEVGRWLMRAVLEQGDKRTKKQATKKLREFRGAFVKQSQLRDVRVWLLKHESDVEDFLQGRCEPVELWQRFEEDYPEPQVSLSNFCRELRELRCPSPAKNAPLDR